jgi:NADH:ubiquinone oxidoreductase subunit 5 (subunit L)/multisubunit Na+/H+ antiporter MnhA subunit
MEAPVPASALIHSATLVSAGVFLMLKMSFLLEHSQIYYFLTPFIGSITGFFGAICSCYQSDTKKILAYSTISHCGFLIFSTTLTSPEVTIIYLYVHGFFKASVFLCTGNIIRFSKNYQDFRKMGSLFEYLPFEFYSSLISIINLSGMPLTVGFYMKHLLLLSIVPDNFFFFIIYINILMGSMCGVVYSYRFIYYIFFDFKKGNKEIYINNDVINSREYSNTTKGSTFSIIFLIVISYIISIYLISLFFNLSSITDTLNIHNYNNTNYLD